MIKRDIARLILTADPRSYTQRSLMQFKRQKLLDIAEELGIDLDAEMGGTTSSGNDNSGIEMTERGMGASSSENVLYSASSREHLTLNISDSPPRRPRKNRKKKVIGAAIGGGLLAASALAGAYYGSNSSTSLVLTDTTTPSSSMGSSSTGALERLTTQFDEWTVTSPPTTTIEYHNPYDGGESSDDSPTEAPFDYGK